jgi:hypothetical protein
MYNVFRVREAVGAMPWLILAMSRLGKFYLFYAISVSVLLDGSTG